MLNLDAQHASSRMPTAESGNILMTLLLMMALSALVIAASIDMLVEVEIAGDFSSNNAAFVIAESGLMHAMAVIEAGAVGFDDDLAGPDGVPGNADDGMVLGLVPLKPQRQGGNKQNPLRGSYVVQVTDNDDGDDDPTRDVDSIVEVSSLGRWGGGLSRVVATIGMDAGKYDFNGILFNGSIRSTGDIRTIGAGTSFHSNAELLIDGRAVLDGGATATGSLTFNGNSADLEGATVSGADLDAYESSHSGIAPYDVPSKPPLDEIKDRADYVLDEMGFVWDGGGNQVFDTRNGRNDWGAWSFSRRGGWTFERGQAGRDDGLTFYVNTDASVVNAGSAAQPLDMTLGVAGDLEFGAENFWNALDGNDALAVGGSVHDKGREFRIGGNVHVGAEFNLEGTSVITGALLVYGKGTSVMNGDLTIDGTQGGASLDGGGGGVTIVDWRLDREAHANY